MSVPVNEDGASSASQYSQPIFGQPTMPSGMEPTTEQLTATDHLVKRAAEPKKADWPKRIVVSLLVATFLTAVGYTWNAIPQLLARANQPTTYSKPQKQPACAYPMREVESASGQKAYCLTGPEYDALIASAEQEYADALKRGKPVYGKWLVAHKLDVLKSTAAREKAAKTYVCQSDYSEGALYAATKAGIGEDELTIAIGDKLITIDGYNPEDVFCVDGKPGVPPRPPVPKMQPKDPSNDPSVNGNAGDAGGPNQLPQTGPGVHRPLPPSEPSPGPVNTGDPSAR